MAKTLTKKKTDSPTGEWKNLIVPAGANAEDLRKLIPQDTPAPLPAVVIPHKVFHFKKFSCNQRMSEETLCFSAEVYLNGKHLGMVCNQGQGGDSFLDGGARELQQWLDTLPSPSMFQDAYDSILTVQKYPDPSAYGWWNSTSKWSVDHFLSTYAGRMAAEKPNAKLRVLSNYGQNHVPARYKGGMGDGPILGVRWHLPATAFGLKAMGFVYYPDAHPLAPYAVGWGCKDESLAVTHTPTGRKCYITSLEPDEYRARFCDDQESVHGPTSELIPPAVKEDKGQ